MISTMISNTFRKRCKNLNSESIHFLPTTNFRQQRRRIFDVFVNKNSKLFGGKFKYIYDDMSLLYLLKPFAAGGEKIEPMKMEMAVKISEILRITKILG